MNNFKKEAAQVLFKGGLHLVPLMSDQRFMSIFNGKLDSIPYPDGRDFVSRVLLCTKQAISSPQTRKAATRVLNTMIRLFFEAEERRDVFLKTYGYDAPIMMVVSPSMTCNLRCYGCYAGEYNKADDLDANVLERLVNEAKEMGIFFITTTGGEPFFSQDACKCGRSAVMFCSRFTNGTD
jgi:hypothetical protein